jgi:hypothetical protein
MQYHLITSNNGSGDYVALQATMVVENEDQVAQIPIVQQKQ